MNCTECRDRLVALAEKLLEAREEQASLAHLRECAHCRAEYEAVSQLQRQLTARGLAAAKAGLVAGVMRRIREQPPIKKETLMSQIMKHRWGFGLGAAAGAAAVATAIFIAVLPKAFGVEQVIQAYDRIHSLHVKTFAAGRARPNEFWIQCDDQGRAEKARYDLPQTEDGEKLIAWTPEKAEIWFKSKHGFLILQTSRIAPMMQELLDASQPKLVMEKLQSGAKAGTIDVQTQEPGGAQTNALIIATHRDKPLKDIYYVDRQTDLIARIEHYGGEGANAALKSYTEFSDYNVPIDEKMFELQGDLPPDVKVRDQLTQMSGVAQGNLTDEEAAVETVRQFFQAIKDKDFKSAGLIYSGEQEADARRELGSVTIARIISIGPAELQTNWVKRGYRVPCQLEITRPDGGTYTAEPGPYVRPGDDEAHPDRWNITGGVGFGEGRGGNGEVNVLPDNAKYAAMTPEETARAFFEACRRRDWAEAGKFMPYLNDHTKQYLGGLTIVSLGDSFTADKYPGGQAPLAYPGRFVPYVIALPPQEFNVRVANTNAARRYVLTGLYDTKLQLQQDVKWSGEPEILTNNELYARMSPKEVVQAYFDAQSKLDWTEMRKFTSEYDVSTTKQDTAAAEQAGLDVRKDLPVFEVLEAVWVPEQSAWFVKCRASQTKRWYLALRNDNAAHRWQVDGGI